MCRVFGVAATLPTPFGCYPDWMPSAEEASKLTKRYMELTDVETLTTSAPLWNSSA
jgi:hypothetical protein